MKTVRNKKVFESLALVLLIYLFCSSTAYGLERKKKLLVLHSYHQGLSWTDQITDGIKSIFDPLESSIEVHYQYLNAKRSSSDHFKTYLLWYRETMDHFRIFDVVIVSDNAALDFVIRNRSTLFENIPVIFCGINNFSPELIEGVGNITGVAETSDYRTTLEIMRSLHPQKNKILVILDKTQTGNIIREEFEQVEEDFKDVEFVYFRDFLLQEVPEKLKTLGDQYLIYMITFNRDREGNFISYREGIELISKHSSAPIYGSWNFYLGKGIVGGAITTGYQQGKTAALLALRVFNGEKAEAIEIVTDTPIELLFDYTYLQKHGIQRSQLPAGSSVINTPPSFIDMYKNGILTIAIMTFIGVVFLSWRYLRQSKILANQQQQNELLDQRVREKTLELKKANKELSRLSYIDGLTKLYNRRYFDSQLTKEWHRLQRIAQPISLLLCDIDFFKEFNDSYGHQKGDEGIQKVAQIIMEHSKRSIDIPARYGGEEFAVILPQTDSSQARILAERIRHGVECENILHSSSKTANRLSISIGVATTIPKNGEDPASLVSLADRALYQSKREGRDRVTFLPKNSHLD